MKSSSILEHLFLMLPTVTEHHSPDSKLHSLLKMVARKEVESLFSDFEPGFVDFKPFGELALPYYTMGAVDSLNLFDLDELIIFTFYWINRKRYRHVLDVGANIGLHSLILAKCGYDICAYEPDPIQFEILQRNLVLNNCPSVRAFNAAVSSKSGRMEFVRVLGNTTGSHLAGSKPHPYGDLERFPVNVERIEPLLAWADLMKLDVEGHEKDILLATTRKDWESTDALVEVQNPDNAAAVYEHFDNLGVALFAQKLNWRRVRHALDMPTNYREGTLFVTCRSEMPWGGTRL